MKKIFSMIFALMLIFSSTAQAEEVSSEKLGMYVTPKIVYSSFTGDSITGENVSGMFRANDQSFGWGIAVGYDAYENYKLPVRVELEYVMRSDAKLDVVDTRMTLQSPQTVFANTYFDLHNSTNLIPYLTTGAGVSIIDSQHSFAWNFGAGVKFVISESFDLDVSAKYVDFGQYTNVDTLNTDLKGIDIGLGVVYKF